MYLTIKQHDKFRTLLMGFEIPFRTYIARTIINKYPNEIDFENALCAKNKLIGPTSPEVIKNNLPKLCKHNSCIKTYNILKISNNSTDAIVPEDLDVPFVSTLNVVSCSLTEDFSGLYSLFSSYNAYCECAEMYRFARNHLDHPGSRTLEEQHLIPVLSFVKDICMFLDNAFFIQKTKEEILSEATSLQHHKISIPVAINNFSEMPYNESRIVCRNTEIKYIKDFVYGKPENLRKQHSCCIYGYGGVGKTALVIEAIKQIVGDILDNITVNEYMPKYILFFSAKKRKLSVSDETGSFIEQQIRSHFESYEELISLIKQKLNLDSLRNFHDDGIIVVDNLETLSIDERDKIKEFIDMQTPSEMQFILTSRNSEEYDSNYKLGGFDSESGRDFLISYCEENSLDLELSDEESDELLSLAKGNTLVLVLSLRRLSQQMIAVSTLKSEFASSNAWKSLRKGLRATPSTNYEVLAEFMYKDTFEHIEVTFAEYLDLFYKVLKVFAVISTDSIDINTICLLTKENYKDVESVVGVLCNFLILEKKDTQYSLNGFAEKYIVNRFLPDATQYDELSSKINEQKRKVEYALKQLDEDINDYPELKKILGDWQIISDIDRINAAKMYEMYGKINDACNSSSRFKTEGEIEDFLKECDEAERMTAHPYIKYQKARVFQCVDNSNIFTEKHIKIIKQGFRDTIYCIKTIEQYSGIQQTKSYSSLLWLFGQYLNNNGENQEAIRYLEESKQSFEDNNITDKEYYQCCALLGTVYLDYYVEERKNRISYLRRSRGVCNFLMNNRDNYDRSVYIYVRRLKESLKDYGDY